MALALPSNFSSTGAISQLVATGQMNAILEAQDGGATLFRSTYSKISPFALNQEIIKAGGSACCHCNFASDSSHTFQVPRASDLISRVYLKLSLPGLALVHQLYVALKAQGGARLGTQALIKTLRSLNHA